MVDPGIGDPFDVAVAQLAFQQALGVADAVQAEMADIGFRGDEGHRHLVANAPLAQFGVEDEGELIGRAEAGGALHRADHDGAGICRKFLQRLECLLGMIDMADGLGEAFGPKPGNFVEGQFRAGGDDQIIVSGRCCRR